MKIQLTIPTSINGKEILKLLKKLKNESEVWFGDWEREKVARIVVGKKNIQLKEKANITFESSGEVVKFCLMCLEPIFRILVKEKIGCNFLRIIKSTPEEWLKFNEFKPKNVEKCLKCLIKTFGIPHKKFHKELFKAIIRSHGKTIKEVKEYLKNFRNNSIPTIYIEILRKVLE